MAVEDKYVNADKAAGKKAVPALLNGDEGKQAVTTFEVAVADDNGSIFRVFRVNATMIPIAITVTNDTITAGTDYDVGIYDVLDGPTGGSAKDADGLGATLDLSSAHAEGAGLTGLGAIDLANADQPLWFHAGDTETDHPGEYDIALTGVAVGSAAGTITVKATFVQGN